MHLIIAQRFEVKQDFNQIYPAIFSHSLVDPSGKYAHIVAGAMFGAVASGVSSYIGGARGNDLLAATTTGAIAGAAAASGGAAIAAGVSAVANLASQVAFDGKSLNNLDYSKAAISGIAGGIGAGIGGMAGDTVAKGMSSMLQYEAGAAFSVGIETTASKVGDVVSNVVGNLSGGIAETAGLKFSEQPASTHSSGFSNPGNDK